MSRRYPPVTDWANDFDHTDPEWVADPYAIWDDLRERCPVAHTDRYGGTWLPLTHELVSEVAYDTERFTSRAVVVTGRRPGPEAPPAPIGVAPPISSDPPFHAIVRRMLIPAFAPKAIAALEPFTRDLCRELLDATAGKQSFDAAIEYTRHIPVRVIVRFLGFPQADADRFRDFIRRTMEDVDQTPEVRDELLGELDDYMDAQIADHRANPRDDLTTFLNEAEIYGEKLSIEHIRGTMVLLMIAGIDTTWSAIGAALWHLASNPPDRRRLAAASASELRGHLAAKGPTAPSGRAKLGQAGGPGGEAPWINTAEPHLMDTAIEEFLRAYAPVTMARLVARDCDFHGHQMKAGDWLLLPFPAANRDPAAFDDADRVLIDRTENRHAAFGLGRHRCLGSNLARMELRVALEEWLARYPDFELADPSAVAWSAGQIRGPRKLPLRIGENRQES
jgi:cytochrome P450